MESAAQVKKLSKQSDLVIVVDILSSKMHKYLPGFFLFFYFSMNFLTKATQKGVMSPSGRILQEGYLWGQTHLEISVDRSTIDLLGFKMCAVGVSVIEPCLEGIYCKGLIGEN